MDFIDLTREEASQKNCRKHAAHCMLYCRGKGFPETSVMMQLRFDGSFGFVGGYVDHNETWEEALNRELHEEIGFDSTAHPIKPENHVFSSYDGSDDLCVHFYAMELSVSEFCSAERNVFDAKHYGTETMGIVRIPLWTTGRHKRGLPTFLRNQFVGNAKYQLIRGLKVMNILSENLVNKAIAESENLHKM